MSDYGSVDEVTSLQHHWEELPDSKKELFAQMAALTRYNRHVTYWWRHTHLTGWCITSYSLVQVHQVVLALSVTPVVLSLVSHDY